jgi:hypothetical protein
MYIVSSAGFQGQSAATYMVPFCSKRQPCARRMVCNIPLGRHDPVTALHVPFGWQAAEKLPAYPVRQVTLHTLPGSAGLGQLQLPLTGCCGLPTHTASSSNKHSTYVTGVSLGQVVWGTQEQAGKRMGIKLVCSLQDKLSWCVPLCGRV